jgi:AcrR family transcriptional regulator
VPNRERRKVADGESRERIMDTAQQLFAEHGYDATSTAKIAAVADVPTGLVFYYFPTKRDLLLATVRERSYQGTLRPAEPASFHAVLTGAAAELASVFSRHRASQMIVFREAGTQPELRQLALGLVASSTGDVAERLAGATDGPADPAVRAAAAKLLVSSLLMDNFLRAEGSDQDELASAVDVLAGALRQSRRQK